jgi:hypothetical protein
LVQLSYRNKKYKNDCCCVGFLSAAEDSSSEQFSGGVGWRGVVAEQEQLDMKGGVNVELYWHLTHLSLCIMRSILTASIRVYKHSIHYYVFFTSLHLKSPSLMEGDLVLATSLIPAYPNKRCILSIHFSLEKLISF